MLLTSPDAHLGDIKKISQIFRGTPREAFCNVIHRRHRRALNLITDPIITTPSERLRHLIYNNACLLTDTQILKPFSKI